MESNNEEPAQPEAEARPMIIPRAVISPSINYVHNTITMSPQMSNNQTSTSTYAANTQ